MGANQSKKQVHVLQDLLPSDPELAKQKERILEQVRHEKEHSHLHHSPPPTDKQSIRSHLRADHHLHHNPTLPVNKSALLTEIRQHHGPRDLRQHNKRTKSMPDLMTEIRNGFILHHHGEPTDKHSVLQELRKVHGHARRHSEPPHSTRELLMAEIRALHGNTDKLHWTQTIDKHSVLAELRHEHGLEHLHHAPPASPRSTRALMTDIRSWHGSKDKLHCNPVMLEKQTLLSAVRHEHGATHLRHAPQSPKSITNLMTDIRALHGDLDKLHWTQTVDKQAMLSQVRREHGSGRHLV